MVVFFQSKERGVLQKYKWCGFVPNLSVRGDRLSMKYQGKKKNMGEVSKLKIPLYILKLKLETRHSAVHQRSAFHQKFWGWGNQRRFIAQHTLPNWMASGDKKKVKK